MLLLFCRAGWVEVKWGEFIGVVVLIVIEVARNE